MEHHRNDTNKIRTPMSLTFFGEGAPVGNDPGRTAQSRLAQTLAYLCRTEEKSAAWLARETGVPMLYIEEELERQCRGENGEYGLLRCRSNGKYISNIIIADRKEYIEVNELYRKYAAAFCGLLAESVEAGREELRSFTRRNMRRDTDLDLLLWAMIPDLVGGFGGQVCDELAGYFVDVRPVDRPFTAAAVAGLQEEGRRIYRCDSIVACGLCGYSNVLARNLYGGRLAAHFRCGHDMAADPLLRLTIRCADGRPLSALSYEERKITDSALRQGYLRERGGALEPAILVLADGISVYMEFQSLLGELKEKARQLASDLAGELAGPMRRHIPDHLLADYPCYGSGIANHRFFHDVVEECIRREILGAPSAAPGPEGVLMVLCV